LSKLPTTEKTAAATPGFSEQHMTVCEIPAKPSQDSCGALFNLKHNEIPVDNGQQ